MIRCRSSEAGHCAPTTLREDGEPRTRANHHFLQDSTVNLIQDTLGKCSTRSIHGLELHQAQEAQINFREPTKNKWRQRPYHMMSEILTSTDPLQSPLDTCTKFGYNRKPHIYFTAYDWNCDQKMSSGASIRFCLMINPSSVEKTCHKSGIHMGPLNGG
jgi:hypothetical protein